MKPFSLSQLIYLLTVSITHLIHVYFSLFNFKCLIVLIYAGLTVLNHNDKSKSNNIYEQSRKNSLNIKQNKPRILNSSPTAINFIGHLKKDKTRNDTWPYQLCKWETKIVRSELFVQAFRDKYWKLCSLTTLVNEMKRQLLTWPSSFWVILV